MFLLFNLLFDLISCPSFYCSYLSVLSFQFVSRSSFFFIYSFLSVRVLVFTFPLNCFCLIPFNWFHYCYLPFNLLFKIEFRSPFFQSLSFVPFVFRFLLFISLTFFRSFLSFSFFSVSSFYWFVQFFLSFIAIYYFLCSFSLSSFQFFQLSLFYWFCFLCSLLLRFVYHLFPCHSPFLFNFRWSPQYFRLISPYSLHSFV